MNNTDPLDSPGNHGRLSRWFSIRRGSTQQYDVDSSDTVSLTSPIKAPQMPQLCEVIMSKDRWNPYFLTDKEESRTGTSFFEPGSG